jgi:N-acetylmuramoyl-L-alanine amidase
MRLRRYRGRHLRPANKKRGPVVIGTAAAVWFTGGAAKASVHVVRRGETLSDIAARYGTSTSSLASANGLSDPNYIVAGTTLRVPVALTMNATHTVSSGETLSDIAARYGTSVRALARVNRLRNENLIVEGAQLRVPGSGTAASTSPSAPVSVMGGAHAVSRGETLSSIALRYGTTVEALARANGIGNPNLVVAGTTLRVPSGGGGGSGGSLPAPPPPASPEVVAASLENQAVSHGVDATLVKAVAWQESGWQQDVVSSAGAIGVMQVMPDTARYINQSLGGGNLDVRNADDNVHLGVMYLHHLLNTMPTERKALAAYYAGPGAIGRRLNAEQRHYVDAVQSHKPGF